MIDDEIEIEAQSLIQRTVSGESLIGPGDHSLDGTDPDGGDA